MMTGSSWSQEASTTAWSTIGVCRGGGLGLLGLGRDVLGAYRARLALGKEEHHLEFVGGCREHVHAIGLRHLVGRVPLKDDVRRVRLVLALGREVRTTQASPSRRARRKCTGISLRSRAKVRRIATSAQLGSSSAEILAVPLLKLQVMRTSVPLVGAILRRCAAALRNGAGGRGTW